MILSDDYRNELLTNTLQPCLAAPGRHEVRFQMSDYSIIRPIIVQRGKTYKVALTVGITVSEKE